MAQDNSSILSADQASRKVEYPYYTGHLFLRQTGEKERFFFFFREDLITIL